MSAFAMQLPPMEGLPRELRRRLDAVFTEHRKLREYYESGDLETLRSALIFVGGGEIWNWLNRLSTKTAS